MTEKMNSNEIKSCILELDALGYRITSSLSIFKDIIKELDQKKGKNKDFNERFATIKILWEYMEINVFKLCEIHNTSIGRMLMSLDEKNLETSLKPSWEKIKDNQLKLKEFRNLLSHSQKPSGDWKLFTDLDPTLNIQTDLITCAHTAIYYIAGILRNLPDLYGDAQYDLKQRDNQNKIDYDLGYGLSDAEKTSKKILEETNSLLEKNGYCKTSMLGYRN